MVARASASVFVGTRLCQNPELVSSFQEITGDLGSYLRFENYWLEPFPVLMKLKMWCVNLIILLFLKTEIAYSLACIKLTIIFMI